MTPVNFAYWLQGFFEISEVQNKEITLTPEQVKMIRAHLNLVFFHAIDSETMKDKTDIEKLKYQKIHDGAKSGDAISPKEFDELIKSIQPHDTGTIQAKDFPKSQDWPKATFKFGENIEDTRIVYNC